MADRLFYKIMEFKSSPIVNRNKKEDVIIVYCFIQQGDAM